MHNFLHKLVHSIRVIFSALQTNNLIICILAFVCFLCALTVKPFQDESVVMAPFPTAVLPGLFPFLLPSAFRRNKY